MGLFQQLTEKSWIEEGVEADPRERAAPVHATSKVGLWVFLGTITSLFSLFLSANYVRMGYPDWKPMTEHDLLWFNTGLLVVSSLAMQWAVSAARRRKLNGVRNGLALGGVFAFAFLAGQLLVWRDLVDQGHYITTNPANAFYYVLTALHGVHLSGGLIAWARTFARAWRDYNVFDVRLSVELCAIYWHYLLGVWIVLFAVLLIT
jgi:cytochrome c oxidase subunit 3